MKTNRQTLHVAKHARTDPASALTGALRTDPLARAARGIIITAVVLGSLGTEAAVSSAYGTVGHASGHQSAGNVSLAASVRAPARSSPWMY
jgi:hypothetical protein